MADRFVIIGGGLTAATAAEALREHGFAGSLRVIAGEAHNPYERPPLSKGYLLGKDGRDSIFPKPGAWYSEQHVSLTTGDRASSIGDHLVTLESGTEVPFDRLLIATGAIPNRPAVPGADADGVHLFRTVDDSEALKATLEGGTRRVVVVGSGWIGLELAAAAREYGNEVVVVSPSAVPLRRALGDELGAVFQQLHEEHGVRFELGAKVTGFATRDGAVTAVEHDRGTTPADLVIVGIGVTPDTALAEAAGIEVDDGILTDEHLATSSPDIFAAGDVANPYHPVLRARLRNEHWANAIAGGKVAAASMAGRAPGGRSAVLDDIPYFFTDQYDLGMEYSGYPPLAQDARVVYRGDRGTREFIAFWLKDDRVVAGMNVNVWDVNEQVQRLIREDRKVGADALADPDVDLSTL